MIPGLEQTPPEVAYAFGFMTALALRRGRIEKIINNWFPLAENDEKAREGE